MRTTIEISDEHYVALRTLAASRGMRGFSPLIGEAIAMLLSAAEQERVEDALALAGSLSEDEADRLEETLGELRRRPARAGADTR